ncbi:MAG: ABC transporter ATP-binding protein, partial [Pseudomonadota bacterium]
DIVEALGETTLLYFRGEADQDGLVAKLPGIQTVSTGQRVRLTAATAKVHLFDAEGRSFLYR